MSTEHTVEELQDVLIRNGFVRCDIAACNCGSWHARYGLRERFEELEEMLDAAGHPLCNENGNLVRNALQSLIEERDSLLATPAPGAPGQEAIAGTWPAELPLRIQVSYSPGDWDTFVYGVSGHLSMDVLTEIEAAIRGEDSEALFDHGPGDYLLSASYFSGQYGSEGRCEWAPCWEFDIEGFRPPAVDPAALPPSGAGEVS